MLSTRSRYSDVGTTLFPGTDRYVNMPTTSVAVLAISVVPVPLMPPAVQASFLVTVSCPEPVIVPPSPAEDQRWSSMLPIETFVSTESIPPPPTISDPSMAVIWVPWPSEKVPPLTVSVAPAAMGILPVLLPRLVNQPVLAPAETVRFPASTMIWFELVSWVNVVVPATLSVSAWVAGAPSAFLIMRPLLLTVEPPKVEIASLPNRLNVVALLNVAPLRRIRPPPYQLTMLALANVRLSSVLSAWMRLATARASTLVVPPPFMVPAAQFSWLVTFTSAGPSRTLLLAERKRLGKSTSAMNDAVALPIEVTPGWKSFVLMVVVPAENVTAPGPDTSPLIVYVWAANSMSVSGAFTSAVPLDSPWTAIESLP